MNATDLIDQRNLRDDVPDFVPEHSPELRVGLGHRQEARVHADLPPRKCEGIDLRIVENDDLPLLDAGRSDDHQVPRRIRTLLQDGQEHGGREVWGQGDSVVI